MERARPGPQKRLSDGLVPQRLAGHQYPGHARGDVWHLNQTLAGAHRRGRPHGQTLALTYYNFAFPDATKLLMINKMHAPGSTVRNSLPASFLYYDKGLYVDTYVGAWDDEVFINGSRAYVCSDYRNPDAPERFVDIDANLLTDRVNTVTFETTDTTHGYEFDIFIVYNDA